MLFCESSASASSYSATFRLARWWVVPAICCRCRSLSHPFRTRCWSITSRRCTSRSGSTRVVCSHWQRCCAASTAATSTPPPSTVPHWCHSSRTTAQCSVRVWWHSLTRAHIATPSVLPELARALSEERHEVWHL